mmetsp:Transcript_114/g.461  ORF Transcript_114/g.461 Transcript_114/m.461 type:complete len:230 (-) Transcript_114:270-959(-)
MRARWRPRLSSAPPLLRSLVCLPPLVHLPAVCPLGLGAAPPPRRRRGRLAIGGSGVAPRPVELARALPPRGGPREHGPEVVLEVHGAHRRRGSRRQVRRDGGIVDAVRLLGARVEQEQRGHKRALAVDDAPRADDVRNVVVECRGLKVGPVALLKRCDDWVCVVLCDDFDAAPGARASSVRLDDVDVKRQRWRHVVRLVVDGENVAGPHVDVRVVTRRRRAAGERAAAA